MYLTNILGNGGPSGAAAIKGNSGVTAATSLCVLNDLASLVSGVTSLPSAFMGRPNGVPIDFASDSAADIGPGFSPADPGFEAVPPKPWNFGIPLPPKFNPWRFAQPGAGAVPHATAAGTGAWQFWCYGLGPNFIPQVRLYTLNGLTLMSSPDFWTAVFAVSIASVGSGGSLAGNLWMAAHGQGVFIGGAMTAPAMGGILKVPAGYFTGYSGWFTVPKLPGMPVGFSGRMAMKKLTVAVAGQACRLIIVQDPNLNDGTPGWDGLPGYWLDCYFGAGEVVPFDDLTTHQDTFGPGTDIVPMIQPASAGAIVTATLDLA